MITLGIRWKGKGLQVVHLLKFVSMVSATYILIDTYLYVWCYKMLLCSYKYSFIDLLKVTFINYKIIFHHCQNQPMYHLNHWIRGSIVIGQSYVLSIHREPEPFLDVFCLTLISRLSSVYYLCILMQYISHDYCIMN